MVVEASQILVASAASEAASETMSTSVALTSASLAPAHREWSCFPGAVAATPPVRLDASKYLAKGIYRRVRAFSLTYFILIAEIEDDTTVDAYIEEYVSRTGAPAKEVFVSFGTACLRSEEIAVYSQEPVTVNVGEAARRHDGVLFCGSRW